MTRAQWLLALIPMALVVVVTLNANGHPLLEAIAALGAVVAFVLAIAVIAYAFRPTNRSPL
jgi:drug/metabolite transporter (DMT)-like permease